MDVLTDTIASAPAVDFAVASDLPAVTRLIRQAKEVFPFLPGAVFEKALEAGELLVCREGEQVLGAVHFHHRRDNITTLHEIVVSPDRLCSGVGNALMEALETQCRLKSQRRIRLKCPVDLPANGFYRQSGFSRVGIEPGRKRSVAVWERPVKSVALRQGAWDFYASLTSAASDIRRLIRGYYDGYDGTPPLDPFRRIIFTPLFSPPMTFRLFQELRATEPDPAVTRLAHKLPRPTVMFDSGGYQVQMGKMSYSELCERLRTLYEREQWADWFVLPDHVPTSADSDLEAAQKAEDTLAVGENFIHWMPELRERFVGVVHGRTEMEMRRGAERWHELGVNYLGFGSFGTSGPNGSVNMVSARSLAMLQALSETAVSQNQKIHVFGIGNPAYLGKFQKAGIVLESFDSSNWWKMGGYGYVFSGSRTIRITQTHRQRGTIENLKDANAISGHACPFCASLSDLRTVRWSRILHNLSVFLEGVQTRSIR